MKILITGINGLLGNSIKDFFSHDPNAVIYGATRTKTSDGIPDERIIGDLSKESSYELFKEITFDVVIHCAAEVNLKLCEEDWNVAETTNVRATRLIATELSYRKIIYISTDSVFDGQTGNYTEEDTAGPLNNYAKSKLLGEQVIMDHATHFLIIRTNIYGFSRPLKGSLFEWAYQALKLGTLIHGYENVYFNPMYVGQLARIIGTMLENPGQIENGIYHVTTDEVISKYGFLKKIAGTFGFDASLIGQSNYTSEQDQLKRPLNTTLNNRKIKSVLSGANLSMDYGFALLKQDFEIDSKL